MEIFRLDNIFYTYRDGKKALDDISLKVCAGESLSIIGANGSGKSTLLYILNGLLGPDSGGLTVFGRPLNEYSRFREKVSLLFQNPQVQLFSLSVWDELCFGPLQLGLDSKEIERRAEDILALIGISHLKDRPPWNLSGGEMKKVALGACLSMNPDVILLDEPTTGLDPRSQVEFIDLIVALREAGKTIITSTHDLGIVQDISDKTIVMGEDHRVMLEGKPWDVIRDDDALLKANLIHRRSHRHNWYVHEHTSSGLHEHEHIPEITDVGEAVAERIGPEGKKEIGKLKILLSHWMEHNVEHADTYAQWAEKAKALGSSGLAGILTEIAEETKKTDRLFEKARKLIETDDGDDKAHGKPD